MPQEQAQRFSVARPWDRGPWSPNHKVWACLTGHHRLIDAFECPRQGSCGEHGRCTVYTSAVAAGIGLRPGAVVLCREIPETSLKGGFMYQAPKLERLGTFREITQAGGDFSPGDGTNAFHRYTP